MSINTKSILKITLNKSAALVSVGNKNNGEEPGRHALDGAPLAMRHALEAPTQAWG